MEASQLGVSAPGRWAAHGSLLSSLSFSLLFSHFLIFRALPFACYLSRAHHGLQETAKELTLIKYLFLVQR